MTWTERHWAALIARRDGLLRRGVRRAVILARLEAATSYLARRMVRR